MMNNEIKEKNKKIKKHSVLNHPILALFLLMFWGTFFYSISSAIFQMALGEDYSGWGAALGAVIVLVIHRLWFSPEFKGAVRVQGLGSKDVRIAFWCMAMLVLIIDLLGFVGHEIKFTIPNLGLALMAGIGEEVSVRVLPISVMMRDWMDEKHIPFIAYSTAVLFGLFHLLNVLVGAPFDVTVIQIIMAIGLGIFFAALYLRTGNIMLCIIFHTIHDMLGFMVVGLTENGVIQSLSVFDAASSLAFGLVAAIFGIYLIRKSVRAKIVSVWEERWNRV